MSKRLPSDLSAASINLLQTDEPLDKKIVGDVDEDTTGLDKMKNDYQTFQVNFKSK